MLGPGWRIALARTSSGTRHQREISEYRFRAGRHLWA
jgi:hypothetical protein